MSLRMPADKLAERALFGSSSDEEGEEELEGVQSADDKASQPHFELLRGSRIPRGLSLHRGALDRETTKTLFDVLSKALKEEEDGGKGGCQVFYFGGLPRWATALSQRALSTLLLSQSGSGSGCSWPRELAEREPLFDMAAVNSYVCCSKRSSEKEEDEEKSAQNVDGEINKNGDGLRQHVDLPRVSDGVAIFSLGCPAVMRFEEVGAAAAAGAVREEEKEGGVAACLLCDGDLLLLSGESRWRWTHGFSGGDHYFRGAKIDRKSGGLRIGVTLRRMKKEEGSE